MIQEKVIRKRLNNLEKIYIAELLKFVSKYFKRNFLNKKITYGKIRRH